MYVIVSPVGISMGVIPPAGAVSWLSTFDNQAVLSASMAGGAAVVSPTPAVVPTTSLIKSGIPRPDGLPQAVVPAGSYMGEGLIPIPERLSKKILNLEFVEMRDLMPETWMREEEESARNTLCLPRRKSAPVTDILQWLQCFSAMVGVLSQKFPRMVPELMAYQAVIIKCSRDFDGLAWAQYDRAYRRQAALTKDLRWSRLNPTLYSLCFAGKAKRNVACAYCLSDTHSSEGCPDHPTRSYLPWQYLGNSATNVPRPPSGPKSRICHLFNAKDGPRCNYMPCKFIHACSGCGGNHPRSACLKGQGSSEMPGVKGGRGVSFKRPRQE